jgi:hypothetical protein
MPSIAAKQSKLLKSGLLDSLGSSDRGDSLSLSNSAAKMVEMAEFLISEAQENLSKDGSVSTGELESSIHAENIEVDGSKLSLDIVLLDRYKFIDEGVNGVKQKQPGAKMSFRTIHPSKKMVLSVLKWIRRGRNASLSIRKPKSKTEEKNLGLRKAVKGSDRLKSLAYAVSTNIKKKGIKRTKFFTNAVKKTETQYSQEIAEGFKLDIIESLPDKI